MPSVNYLNHVFDLIKGLSPYELGLATGLAYLVLVRTVRYRRRDGLQREYGVKTREDFAKMTATEAQEIVRKLSECEFPFTVEKGLQFALFKTYGIPSISKLLVKTKQLSYKEAAPRRLADTEILIAEFIGHAPDSERANSAIARMNYLHSLYQKQGLISNDDMLYTLSLFVIEPIRWVRRYEWREMTDFELCAFGTFWKSVGDAMNISYEDVPGSKAGWKDGLDWFRKLETWSLAYEEKSMVPDDANHQTASHTTNLLLSDVPSAMHPVGIQAVSALMEDRLRVAMIYPEPNPVLKTTLLSILALRKYALRYLALPRPYFMRVSFISSDVNAQGKYFKLKYLGEPWYVEDSFSEMWLNPQTWIKWLMGRPIPGKKYQPDGYDISHVGPKVLEGKGLTEWNETKEKLMKADRGGCPFAVKA